MKNYVFPELAYYSKEWVPILEAAKLALDQEDYLCHAVTAAARVCETQYGGTAWQELGYSIKAAISNSLGRHMTVSTWHWHTFGKSISRCQHTDESSLWKFFHPDGEWCSQYCTFFPSAIARRISAFTCSISLTFLHP